MRYVDYIAIAAVLTAVLCTAAPCEGGNTLPVRGAVYYSVASWYGADFHGKRTASGELFNMHDFTCAHRSFPFGSWLKITNILNNKSTVCVVNDRGPFERFRELDLSFAAAGVLDMISLGLAAVRIEYLGIDTTFRMIRDNVMHHPLIIKCLTEKRCSPTQALTKFDLQRKY